MAKKLTTTQQAELDMLDAAVQAAETVRWRNRVVSPGSRVERSVKVLARVVRRSIWSVVLTLSRKLAR